LTTYLEGEAREVGNVAAALAREIALHGRPIERPALIVAGGETTVTLRGNGLGGRNQELALGAVSALAGLDNTLVIALATDGGDGPTDAAGAVVSGETLACAQAQGLDPATSLQHNDAYHFFAALDDLLRPGPTLTNVNDLLFIAAL
ncbi:MAG TPA: MOFRL family protein, partial [Herpetosiphonaceae bacterium]